MSHFIAISSALVRPEDALKISLVLKMKKYLYNSSLYKLLSVIFTYRTLTAMVDLLMHHVLKQIRIISQGTNF